MLEHALILFRNLLPVVLCVVGSSLHATSIRVVAMSGVPAPGASGETFETPYTDFLPLYVYAPALNAKGDVAFGATTQRFSRSLSGVWMEETGLLRSVAYGTAPAPGTGRNFAGYGIPTLTSTGDIVFSAAVGEGGSTDQALMLETAEGLSLIVVEGESGFGSQLGQAIFSHIAVNDGGNIAFAGRVLVGFPSQQRLFKTTTSGLLKFATNGGDAPVIGFPFRLNGLSNVHERHGRRRFLR